MCSLNTSMERVTHEHNICVIYSYKPQQGMSDSECIVSGYLSYLNKYIKQEITQSLHYHSMTVFRATTSDAVGDIGGWSISDNRQGEPIYYFNIFSFSLLLYLFFYDAYICVT